MSNIIRPRQIAGEFKIIKGEGKSRRLLAYVTECGCTGTSARWNREEAYQAALAERAKRRAALAPSSVPVRVDSVKTAHTSTLCAELERRGYAICPAELVGLDRKGDALANSDLTLVTA